MASSYPPPAHGPFTTQSHACFDSPDASSMALRVSFVNLQKFTLKPCEDCPSIRMLAPAQKTRSLPDVSTTAPISGCSKRKRWTAS